MTYSPIEQSSGKDQRFSTLPPVVFSGETTHAMARLAGREIREPPVKWLAARRLNDSKRREAKQVY